MECVQEPNQVGAARTQTRPCGNVGDGGDLELVLDTMEAKRFPGQFMPQLGNVLHHLRLGIVQPDELAHDRPVDDHVHVFVQPHGEYESTMLVVIGGKVSAPAAESDPEGSAGGDHRENPAAPASR